MIVLGLNAFGHDAAAVLLVDGRVAFAASEERYDRVRHSAAFPERAVAAALAHAGIRPAEVDAVAFPWTRGMGRWHKAFHVLRRLPRSLAYLREPPDTLLPDRRSYLFRMRHVEKRMPADGITAPFHRIPHHLAHAASAALALPEGTGAILTADGMGEWTTAATWRAEAHLIKRLRRAVYPHSPGKVYAAITQWLGFRPESGEGKTMGLAAYGDPEDERADFALQHLIGYDARRLCRVTQRFFGFPWGTSRLYGDALVARVGPPRTPEEPLRDGDAHVAHGIQKAITLWGGLAALDLTEQTGATDMSVAGGLFLNCAMNGVIRESRAADGVTLHPFPVAGDAGAAWGAAAEVHRRLTGDAAEPLGSILLGHDITEGEAKEVARRESMHAFDDPAVLASEVAARIAAGRIVGVAHGRAEFGPRALGNRSVLASPTSTASRDRVNELKGREDWRPLAPIVRVEDKTYFEDLVPSPHMILTFEATKRAKDEIPGVVHVDGTARVQTVGPGENDFVRQVLDELESRGEPPVVINTSLNRRGEPIVNTAEEAWTSTQAMSLDALVLGDHLWDREPFDGQD